jgi:hypothetical protein
MAATIGKVSALFTADTSGLKSGVDGAIRSFKQLGGEAGALSSLFAKMQSVTALGVGAAGPAAEKAAKSLAQFQRLANLAQQALKAGRITADQFASKMNLIGQAANKTATSVSRGAQITAQFESAEEQTLRAVDELNGLLAEGNISHEIYGRAMADATGAAAAERRELEAAGKQMAAFAAVLDEGAMVTKSVETAEERHAAELQRLQGLLSAGAISQQTYARSVDKADDELRQAQKATSGLGRAASAASSGVEKLSGKLNTIIGLQVAQLFGQITSAASNAARSMISFGGEQAGVVDATRNLSIRLGMSYGQFAGIAHAANLADVSMESVGNAAQKSEIAFAKAANGSKVANAAFDALGLSVDDLGGMDSAGRFQAIASALQNVPDSAERARLAVALFGRSGGELLPMFEEGAAGISDAVREAERFGLALTQDQANSIDAMGDSFQRAQQAVAGVVQQVVAYLAPALENVVTTFTDLVGGIGGANIGAFIGEGIIAGAEFLATIGDAIISGLTSLWEFVSSVGVQWSGVFDIGSRVAAFLSGVGNSFKFILAAGIVGLTAPVTALLKGADFLAKRVGVDLGVDNFIKGADAFNNSMFQSMTDASEAAGKDFGKAFGESTPAVTAQKGPLSSMLGDALQQARDNAAATSETAKPVVKPKPVEAAAFTGPSTEALKAVDSRSKEGVAEMLRLMRGGGQDVQERQLEVLEMIHDDLSEGDAEEIGVFAGA